MDRNYRLSWDLPWVTVVVRRPWADARCIRPHRPIQCRPLPRLAAHRKRHYAGWTAWILSPELKLPAQMRLKESRRVPLWNGPIECRLFRFDLVAGSMRGAGAANASQGAAPADG